MINPFSIITPVQPSQRGIGYITRFSLVNHHFEGFHTNRRLVRLCLESVKDMVGYPLLDEKNQKTKRRRKIQ
jgi:hypothetical protein